MASLAFGVSSQDSCHFSAPTSPSSSSSSSSSTVQICDVATWEMLNITVLDPVPPMPHVDPSKKDAVLLYIPRRVRVGGEEKDFTLKVLKETSGGPFDCFDEKVEEQFGDTMAPGWVLIDKEVLPGSRNQTYEIQKRMVEARGCSMPSVLEAVALNLMVFASTGERLYGEKPCTYTRCIEKVDDQYPILVGCFRANGLNVGRYFRDTIDFGVACVQRNFS